MPAAPRRKALVLLVLLSLVWSFNWIVMKQVLRDVGPFEFAALRGVLGVAVLFALLAWRRVPLKPPPLLPVLLIGAVQTLGFQALVQWALVEGGAGQTALLAYTCRSGWWAWPGWCWAKRLRACSWRRSRSRSPACCWCWNRGAVSVRRRAWRWRSPVACAGRSARC